MLGKKKRRELKSRSLGASPRDLRVPLTQKQRLRFLKEHLGVGFDALAEAQYTVACETPYKRLVFDGKKANTIGKLFAPNNPSAPWRNRYAEPILAWLRETFHLNPPDDFFVVALHTREELIQALVFNETHEWSESNTRSLPLYGSADENAISLILKRIMASRDDPEYFRRTQEKPLGLIASDAADLKRIVVEGGTLIPGPELGKTANVHLLCTGCGRGSDEYGLFEAVLEAHWARRDEIMDSRIESEADYIGLAEVGARTVQASLLNGDFERATERAKIIEQWASQGLLGKEDGPVVKIRTHISEAIARDAGASEYNEKLLGDSAAAFGKFSKNYITALKCRACRAVALGDKNASDYIEAAREVIKGIPTRILDRVDDRKGHLVDLGFIELTHLEKQHQREGRRMDEALRSKVGVDELRTRIKETNAPLRRAKLLYWLWRATGRSRRAILEQARGFAAERPAVKNLCVFDVAAFRIELGQQLNPA